MRHQIPNVGEIRYRKHFALFPVVACNTKTWHQEVRWLEKVRYTQIRRQSEFWGGRDRWMNWQFQEIAEELR